MSPVRILLSVALLLVLAGLVTAAIVVPTATPEALAAVFAILGVYFPLKAYLLGRRVIGGPLLQGFAALGLSPVVYLVSIGEVIGAAIVVAYAAGTLVIGEILMRREPAPVLVSVN